MYLYRLAAAYMSFPSQLPKRRKVLAGGNFSIFTLKNLVAKIIVNNKNLNFGTLQKLRNSQVAKLNSRENVLI